MEKKIKVCLVFPPHMRIDAYYVTPPIGLLSIAAVLEKNDIEVEVQDHIYLLRKELLHENETINEASANLVLKSKSDIVGFSTQCVTYPTCLNMAKKIKKANPEVITVFGGHNSSFLDVETLEKFPYVDVIVRGEGEVTFLNLVRALQNNELLQNVKGITYRCGDEIVRNEDEELIKDLDSLPIPAYHLVDSLECYRKLGTTLTMLIESGRGCSYNCVFCSNCRLWQRKVRYKSVERVIEEILYHEENNKPDEYYLVHDFFTHSIQYVRDFCNQVIDKGLDIKWNCRCRLNVDKETMFLMKKAGCERLLYGVESGSEKILKFMNKRIEFNKMFDSIRTTIEAGIIPSLSFVMGLPEETLDDVNDTLRLILKSELIGNCYPFMQMISPLPGTPLLENYSRELEFITPTAFSKGIEYDRGHWIEEDRKLIEQFPELFSAFYNIKNKYEDITFVYEVARNYCMIMEMFAHVYFCLVDELNITELELYKEWRKWLMEEQKFSEKDIAEMGRSSVWINFDRFLECFIGPNEKLKSMFLFDLYRYQKNRYQLLAMKSDGSEEVGKPQVYGSDKYEINQNVAVEEFDYDITKILTDLRSHRIGTYSREKCYLLMQRIGYNVKIQSIPYPLFLLLKSLGKLEINELVDSLYSDDFKIIKNDFKKDVVKTLDYFIERKVVVTR